MAFRHYQSRRMLVTSTFGGSSMVQAVSETGEEYGEIRRRSVAEGGATAIQLK